MINNRPAAIIKTALCCLGFSLWIPAIRAQHLNQATDQTKDSGLSSVWVPDLGNGQYKNPVLYADYSDPDVCRVGEDYYLVASSFDAVPGLPILHSKDLVNWSIISHALPLQPPVKHFSKVQHGNGVWAPAIRYHQDSFYIYYPDPDFGIYLTKAKTAAGPWTTPILVKPGKGIIDPCPFWDDNGQAYLVHAFAGSRAGIKSVIAVCRLSDDGSAVMDQGTIVYDGHGIDPTIEGPKLYKRGGYYYIFAPAGGVPTGYQLVLRSKNIYGPYERKIVMAQGNSPINGPHQGAWIQTPDGKQDWFIHFTDQEAYGRVTCLEPMHWVNDWPVIGIDEDGDGIGTPVLSYAKPDVGRKYPVQTPATSDEFNPPHLGKQWQWQANPKETWSYLTSTGTLRLYHQKYLPQYKSYWDYPAILSQKFPARSFTATAKIKLTAREAGDQSGFILLAMDYAALNLTKTEKGFAIHYRQCLKADRGGTEKTLKTIQLQDSLVYFRVEVDTNAVCRFSYSIDNKVFHTFDKTLQAVPGKWIGAKIGLYSSSKKPTGDAGYTDIDWFRITPYPAKK